MTNVIANLPNHPWKTLKTLHNLKKGFMKRDFEGFSGYPAEVRKLERA
jgi:hypothetical protein